MEVGVMAGNTSLSSPEQPQQQRSRPRSPLRRRCRATAEPFALALWMPRSLRPFNPFFSPSSSCSSSSPSSSSSPPPPNSRLIGGQILPRHETKRGAPCFSVCLSRARCSGSEISMTDSGPRLAHPVALKRRCLFCSTFSMNLPARNLSVVWENMLPHPRHRARIADPICS